MCVPCNIEFAKNKVPVYRLNNQLFVNNLLNEFLGGDLFLSSYACSVICLTALIIFSSLARMSKSIGAMQLM